MSQELRTYETICLTKVDMPEEKFSAMLDKCKSTIEGEGSGKWLYTDDWGKAKIAYVIDKDARARWTYMRYQSSAKGVDEIQRHLKINEHVLRQMTVRTAEDGSDYNSLRANMPQDLADRERMKDWREDRRSSRGGFRRGPGAGRHHEEDFGGDDDSADEGGDDVTA